MPYFDPDKMTDDQQQRIARWLTVNGCRHYVALEPVVLRGNVVEYVALSRRDKRSVKRMSIDRSQMEVVPLGLKRLRIRVPLRAVATTTRSAS